MDQSSCKRLIQDVTSQAALGYVKGSERAKYIRELINHPVIDLNIFNCLRAKSLPLSSNTLLSHCLYPAHISQIYIFCALMLAMKFKL